MKKKVNAYLKIFLNKKRCCLSQTAPQNFNFFRFYIFEMIELKSEKVNILGS